MPGRVMTWTRLDDTFNDDPIMLTMSRDARLLFIESLVYGNKQLTDGFIPTNVLHRITDTTNLADCTKELLGAGLWERVPGGLQVRWTDQEPAATVQHRRERSAQHSRATRERQDRHRSGDHSKCLPKYCPHVTGHVTGHAVGHVPAVVTDPRPDPSRPVPSVGRGRDERGSPAHPFEDDGSGLTCEACGLPPQNPIHPQLTQDNQ